MQMIVVILSVHRTTTLLNSIVLQVIRTIIMRAVAELVGGLTIRYYALIMLKQMADVTRRTNDGYSPLNPEL